MPQLVLEDGKVVSEVDGMPRPGSEILVRGEDDILRVFVVVRHRWEIPRDGPAACTAIVVRQRYLEGGVAS